MLFKKVSVFLSLTFYSVHCLPQNCQTCFKSRIDEQVCASDGVTYESFCMIKRTSCLLNKEIKFECNGKCPCDPSEILKLDPSTLHKLKDMRTNYQLDEHLKREKYEHEGINENNEARNIMQEFVQQDTINKIALSPKEKCPKSKLMELPHQLIEWFHIMKSNEKERIIRENGTKNDEALKELDFIQAKLNSIYSSLSCSPQKQQDNQDCLLPVQWMFNHLDINSNMELSSKELEEILIMDNEECIKSFLHKCDNNSDGLVVMKEFCRCLCYTPPCTSAMMAVPIILVRGEPKPVPGFYVPRCDEDGFFLPKQCNESQKQCWCANRNGTEYPGTRGTMDTDDFNCDDYIHDKKTKSLVH
uniref:Testican-2 n=1 Tax=Hydra vulgaris TaxID=6087 RepID=T2M8U2_HYDVU